MLMFISPWNKASQQQQQCPSDPMSVWHNLREIYSKCFQVIRYQNEVTIISRLKQHQKVIFEGFKVKSCVTVNKKELGKIFQIW